MRKPLDIKVVANFFDEQKQEYLDPFNWSRSAPNLPVYTIKDFFIAKFYKRDCVYCEGEEEMAKIHFNRIFADGLLIIAQMDELKDCIKPLVHHDNYMFEVKGINSNKSILTGESNVESTTKDTSNNLELAGNISGSADATQMNTLMDETNKVIMTKKILEKSENKLLDFLDPNARQISHMVTMGTKTNNTTNTVNSHNRNSANNTYDTNYTSHRGVVAESILKSVTIEIPKLRDKFLELFNVMFYF